MRRRCCASPRRSQMPAMRAQVADRSHDSPLATPRCPAGRSRPSSALRPSPRRRGALLRATLRSRRLACHITLLARLAPDRRFAKMRSAALRRAAASEYALGACPSHKSLARFSAGNASLPGPTSASPRPRRRLAQMRRHCWAALRRPKMPATRAHIASTFPDSPLATPCCPAGRSRPTFALRPSPAASRGGAARDDAISPASTSHGVVRASRSGPAVCKDAARVVAPRHGVRRFWRRVPKSETVLPILHRQRLAAGPAALTPRLAFASVARGGGLHRCGGSVAPRRGVRRCPRCAPKPQTVVPILRLQLIAARRADLATSLLCVRRPR